MKFARYVLIGIAVVYLLINASKSGIMSDEQVPEFAKSKANDWIASYLDKPGETVINSAEFHPKKNLDNHVVNGFVCGEVTTGEKFFVEISINKSKHTSAVLRNMVYEKRTSKMFNEIWQANCK